jgi:hypothetical protein
MKNNPHDEVAQFCKKPSILRVLPKKKVEKTIRMVFITNVLVKCFESRQRFKFQNFACRSYVTNHRQTIKYWKKGAYFIDLMHIQSQKGQQFKNPAAE